VIAANWKMYKYEDQRERGMTEQVLCRQISQAILQIDTAVLRPMVVAYEPCRLA
jgi:triosephosphate isomerase